MDLIPSSLIIVIHSFKIPTLVHSVGILYNIYITSNQCKNMFTLTNLQKEIITSALKLKLSQLTKLEKKIKAELGDEADAAKSVLKEITLTQDLFREIELSKANK